MHSSEFPTESDESKSGKPRRKIKKRFGMEYRGTPEYIALFKDDPWKHFWGDSSIWRKSYHWYETAKQRDQAMETLSKQCFTIPNKTNIIRHEYRPIER